MPKSLLVMGSGAIGIEFASFYRTMGVEVTVVEVLPQVVPVEDAEIGAFEANRDIGAEILQSIKDMKAGKGKVVVPAAVEAREATGLSQSQFASLLGVSVRTLQGWEQGRKQPSGAARTLLAIARTNPKAVLAVSSQ